MDRKTDRWMVDEAKAPRNRKWVVKNCEHCGKEFGTDTPWRKHCKWDCTYEHMQMLKRARRAKNRESLGVEYTCLGCRAQKGDLAVQLGVRKGLCRECMGVMEQLKFDKGFAYRLGYVAGEYFTGQRNVSRQGHSESTGGR
jgi:hypothetical protein